MKHRWEYVSKSISDVLKYGWEPQRRCANCGAVQIKVSETSWMRVTGYRWEPLVGRCTGKREGKSSP